MKQNQDDPTMTLTGKVLMEFNDWRLEISNNNKKRNVNDRSPESAESEYNRSKQAKTNSTEELYNELAPVNGSQE